MTPKDAFEAGAKSERERQEIVKGVSLMLIVNIEAQGMLAKLHALEDERYELKEKLKAERS